jgi:hypothetical protein
VVIKQQLEESIFVDILQWEAKGKTQAEPASVKADRIKQ